MFRVCYSKYNKSICPAGFIDVVLLSVVFRLLRSFQAIDCTDRLINVHQYSLFTYLPTKENLFHRPTFCGSCQ